MWEPPKELGLEGRSGIVLTVCLFFNTGIRQLTLMGGPKKMAIRAGVGTGAVVEAGAGGKDPELS
jgi:tetrahydromethanopterin S-methyltransferase subunit D